MKRWLIVIAVLGLVCGVALTSFSGWLLNTTAGAVWLFETASSSAGVQMTAGRIEGRLSDELSIDDLVFAWADGQIVVHKIKLDWEPLSALNGNLKIQLLEIDQFIIQDFSPDDEEGSEPGGEEENDIGFSVSDFSSLPDWLVLEIADLQFRGLVYEDLESTVTIIDSVSGSFIWSQQQIVSSAFSYLSPFVNFKGHFDWDLRTTHLDMIADVHLPAELVEHDLFKDIDVPVDFPGVLSLDGDWNNFSGPVSFGIETEDMSAVWLAADAQGSWQGIYFDELKGHYLAGRFEGDLDLWWIDFYRMHGQVLGTGLNPGIFLNDLEGLATLDVVGELFIPYDDNPLTASIGGKIIEAQLRGESISGDLSLDWQYGDLHEVDIDLSSAQSRLFLQGKPSDRLDIDVSIEDLSFVYAELAGQLNSTGWLRWADDYLTGDLNGTGSDVVWHETSLENFNYQASHLKEHSPIEIVIDGKDLRHENLQSDLLYAEVSGSLETHNLLVTLNDQTGQLTTKLAGSYHDDVWRGELTAMEAASSTLGSWALVGPSTLEWMNGGLSLKNFAVEGQKGGRVTLKMSDLGASETSSLNLDWNDIQHGWLTFLRPELNVTGTSSGQFFIEMADQQPVSLNAQMSGSLSLQNAYSPLDVPSISLEMTWVDTGLDLDLSAETDSGEHFAASADSSRPPSWQWPPEQLSFTMNWQNIDLDRLSALREKMEVQGRSDGDIQFEIIDGSLQQAEAKITAEGHMLENSQTVGFSSLNTDLHWDQKILQSETLIKGSHDGLISLKMSSTADPHYNWPGTGEVELKVSDFDLRSFMPLLEVESVLVGAVRGEASGSWHDNGDVSFNGQFGAVDDDLSWHLQDGQVGGSFKRADLNWQWQGSQLEGQLVLQLASGADIQGRWQLPFSAHWPVDFKTEGPLKVDIKGDAQLTEIIPFIAPGVFQDIRGSFTTDLNIYGSLKSPRFSGTLDLLDAGAYLPVTGATIDDLLLRVSMSDDEIHLDKLSLKVGEGKLRGTGLVEFDRWQLEGYRLALHGELLHLYDFPELQLFCSPDLTLSGDLTGTKVRGNILIQEMKLIDKTSKEELLPSNDVVISGEDHTDREKLTFDTDIQVVVELGKKVNVRTAGVETRLEGGVTIGRDAGKNLAGWGEIRLVEGVYKAYGTNLGIKQGLMTYNGGPLENPALRVFAAKDIGRVQAGVHITGTAQNPVVTLASIPAMPERDILGYLFMGRPISSDSEGGDALAIGVGALLPNYGDTLADYGVVELDLDGLLNEDGGVRLRKRLSESWEISSTLGTESGIDLFYILDFD
jgi:autotransporter translocation and assembly factor TamB